MEGNPVFHITVNATVIGSLRNHCHKWYTRYNRRKREAIKDAVQQKQRHFQDGRGSIFWTSCGYAPKPNVETKNG